MKFSIKTKIILFFVLPLALFISAFLYFITSKLEEEILQDFIKRNSLLIGSYATTIDQTLATTMKIVENGAEYLAGSESELSEKEINTFLTQIVRDDKIIFGAVLAFAPDKFPNKNLFAPYVFYDGDTLTYIDITTKRDYTKPEVDWYYIPATTLKPYWTKPYNAPILNDKPLITYSYPVIVNGELYAVLEVDLSLEVIDEFLHKSMPTQKGRFILLDKEGTFISHPVKEKIIKHTLLSDTTSIVSLIEREILYKELVENKIGFKQLKHNTSGKNILSFYAQINNPNWTIIIYALEEDLISVITDLFDSSFMVVLIFFFVVASIVLITIHKLLNPISKIKMFASQLTSGNYNSKIVIKSHDEFGDLADDLNNMSATLKSREDELLKLNTELEDRVKQRTKELSEARDNLDLALSSAEMGTWKFNIKDRIIIGDQNTKKLYGVNDSEFNGRVEDWFKYIHQDDKLYLNELMAKTLSQKEEFYRAEFRVVKPNEEVSYIMSAGRFTYKNDTAVEASGVVWDISNIKNAEQKLNDALIEAKKLSIAVEQSPVLITITDPEANVEYINPEYSKVTGFTLDDVEGKKHTLIRMGAISEKLFERYKRIIFSGRTLRGEFEGRKKDGSLFWVKITGTGIFDDQDEIKNIVFVEDDITNQKKAEFELKEKNEFIAERNKFITDSIIYAKKIQEAILPKDEFVKSLIPNYYLIYKPKDVVSGDFYWLNKIGRKLIIAQIDCTGHGVPGALMSMIGNTLLNEIIVLQNITDTAEILNKLNSRLIEELNKDTNSDSKDGMDVSIVAIDFDDKTMQFSGAYRPLLYTKGNEIIEIKGDRKSIGDFTKVGLKYTSKSIDINEETRIFLFSDGIVDQNNSENKKLGSRKLKELVLATLNENLEVQGEKINKHLFEHQGNEEQRDDISFLAIELKDIFKNSKRKLELDFDGSFTHDFVLKIGDQLEGKYSESLNRSVYKQLYFSALELAQNIGHYSINKLDDKNNSNGFGKLIIQSDENYFWITSTNEIKNSTKMLFVEKLNYYNSLDRDKLKKFLKEKLRSASELDSKGGGIGFLEIIKRTNNPIGYSFTEINKVKSYINLEIKINKGEVDG